MEYVLQIQKEYGISYWNGKSFGVLVLAKKYESQAEAQKAISSAYDYLESHYELNRMCSPILIEEFYDSN